MVKKISCKVIESNPLSESREVSLVRFDFRNTRSGHSPFLGDLKAKAKLYFDNGMNWQSFNCRA